MPTKKVQAAPQTTVVIETIQRDYFCNQQVGPAIVTFSDGSKSEPSTTSFTHVVKEYLSPNDIVYHPTYSDATAHTTYQHIKFTITERF